MPRKPYTPAGEALIKTLDALDPGDDVMLAVHAYLARSAPAPTVDAAALDAVLQERDIAEEWADRLANAIAPMEVIGEHSNLNNPWQNALDYLQAPAAASDARPDHPWNDPDDDGHNCADCPEVSQWKCDRFAHVLHGGAMSLLTTEQRADLDRELAEGARQRRAGEASARNISLAAALRPAAPAPTVDAAALVALVRIGFLLTVDGRRVAPVDVRGEHAALLRTILAAEDTAAAVAALRASAPGDEG